jgi:UDP-N-acetylmuramate: L-alanyl-gamma-D-glutamyl-meso-diaminopimelate ligase
MKLHFISIGGNVMHQLALALHQKGYTITGSDDEIVDPARTNLQLAGILPSEIGWNDQLITSHLDGVILGMHAREDNPELAKALQLGIPVYSFPEYIYKESLHKKRIVIGGSHGKTTTTAMIMHLLQQQRLSFDYLVGAAIKGFQGSVQLTEAPIIVCEGDEYPASAILKKPKFHFLFPHIAVITGIAWDHINVFPTFNIYLEQFTLFIQKIEPGGTLIYNQTDETLEGLVKKSQRTDINYLPYVLPIYRVADGITQIEIDGLTSDLAVFGEHNLLNLQAARLVGEQLGISTKDFLQSMADFSGAAKRLELLAAGKKARVYRDFAHAPSKVMATLSAVRQQFPQHYLIAVLELHTFSSLNEKFMEEYKGALDEANLAAVFYTHHSLEHKKLPPLETSRVKSGFGNESLIILNDRESLLDWLGKQDYQHTVLLLMSSGTFDGANMLTFAETITAQ